MAQFQGHLEKLNQFLADRSYVEGYAPTQADTACFATLGNNVDAAKYAHVARYIAHISHFTAAERARFPGKVPVVEEEKKAEPAVSAAPASSAAPVVVAAAPTAAAAAAADADSDSDFNLSDDDGDDEETKKMMADKLEATREVQRRQQEKAAKGTALSDIAFDIKPAETLEDKDENQKSMETLLEQVRSVKIEGLKWMSYQFIDVAYGIKKLRIMCQIVDIMIPGGPDQVKETIEEQEWAEDRIQSIDVFSFQMAA